MRGSSKVPLKKCVLLLVLAALVVPAVSAQGGDTVGGKTALAPTSLDTNTCYECHSDSAKVEDTSAAEKWTRSVHAENDVGCERCHSASVPSGRLAAFDAFGGSYRDDHVDLILAPDIAYKAPSAFEIEGETGEYSLVVRGGLTRQQSTALCARCHGLTQITPDSPKNVFPDYKASVHGQSVIVKGLGDPARVGKTEVGFNEATGIVESAVCTDCHDAHETKAKDDPTSETYKTNVAETCGTENCHGSDEIAKKYGIVNALKTFEETHHGKALKLGVIEGIPSCPDCHGGGHTILSQTDPESMTYPDNRGKLCSDEKCHGVELNVGAGSLHGRDADTLIGNLIDLFYTIVIPVVVGFFALYVVLDFTLMLGKKGGE
ncbi:MAG: multiheme c-type cytochrome [Candidatus Hydrothermarchaeales archaeon]